MRAGAETPGNTGARAWVRVTERLRATRAGDEPGNTQVADCLPSDLMGRTTRARIRSWRCRGGTGIVPSWLNCAQRGPGTNPGNASSRATWSRMPYFAQRGPEKSPATPEVHVDHTSHRHHCATRAGDDPAQAGTGLHRHVRATRAGDAPRQPPHAQVHGQVRYASAQRGLGRNPATPDKRQGYARASNPRATSADDEPGNAALVPGVQDILPGQATRAGTIPGNASRTQRVSRWSKTTR
jgi:hypothetical protein